MHGIDVSRSAATDTSVLAGAMNSQ
jgi:hypothetical protein